MFFIFLSAGSYAQIGGNYTYSFLNLSNSSRVAALGGKLISMKDHDLNLVFYNPSLLNDQMNQHLSVNYSNYFLDINYGYVGYSWKHQKLGNVSTGLQYISYGNFTRADYTGAIQGEFRSDEYAFQFSWAYQIDSMLTAGVNMKPVFSHFERYFSLGLATDWGITYHNQPKGLTAALVLRNLGFQLIPYHRGDREPLPFEIQLGITQKLAHAPFRFSFLFHHLESFDLTYDKPDELATGDYINQTEMAAWEKAADYVLRHVNVGVEFLPFDSFYFSLGYNFQRKKELQIPSRMSTVGLSWGFGVNIAKFKLGFARSHYHLAGSTNHFSLSTNLSRFYRRQ